MNEIAFRLRLFASVLAVAFAGGVAGLMFAEKLSFLDALYFCLVTVATVGYGDIYPVTPIGKAITMALMVTGVGTFLGLFANATEFMLVRGQEKMRRERLNMVIGLFMSELGSSLLRLFAAADPDRALLQESLRVRTQWGAAEFDAARSRLGEHGFKQDPARVDLAAMRDFLRRNGPLLVRLLENPNLLEHEEFTDLLRAVFHLRDELLSRTDITALPAHDREHLANDAKRAYGLLVRQWLGHVGYLKEAYPFLFSLAIRLNPFDETASPVVKE